MKTVILLLALICAVMLASNSPTATRAAGAKHRAVATFTEPVRLMGVVLKGEYLFVHDDAAMALGEACTYVYKGAAENKDNLVLSFHCMPAPRNRVANFTVRTYQVSPEVTEIKEFQFAGENETHLVPLK